MSDPFQKEEAKEGVTRIGVSLEPKLLEQFDRQISKKGYVSRSEALRDLVRDSLAEAEWKNDHEFMCGVITMIYDHGTTGLGDRLIEIQHGSMEHISANIHMHLDHDLCMEVVVIQGELGDLKKLSNDLGSLKGVHRCKLVMASPSTGHLHYSGVRNA